MNPPAPGTDGMHLPSGTTQWHPVTDTTTTTTATTSCQLLQYMTCQMIPLITACLASGRMQAYLQDASLADVGLVDKLEELRRLDKIKVQCPPGAGWHAGCLGASTRAGKIPARWSKGSLAACAMYSAPDPPCTHVLSTLGPPGS